MADGARGRGLRRPDDGKAAAAHRVFADGGGRARRQDGEMAAAPASAPLVHCRVCSSALLQPLGAAGPIDGLSIVSCFCPDCECTDVVVAEELAVELWLLRAERLMASLEAAADALAMEFALTRATAL
jgi:hypothetical protein